MTREIYHNRRTLAVLFLLCVVVLAQSAALLSAIEPHHATGHCCVLCHVGSLPFLESSAPASLAPNVIVERLIPIPDFEAWHDVLIKSNSSRAPPVA
jgi:hypothetical protein